MIVRHRRRVVCPWWICDRPDGLIGAWSARGIAGSLVRVDDGKDAATRDEPEADRPRRTFLRYARDPIWQMVGVVLALVLASAPKVYDLGVASTKPAAKPMFVGPGTSAGPTTSTGPVVQASAGTVGDINAQIDGDCNAVGVANVVTCQGAEPSMDNVEVGEGIKYWVWFDGAPGSIPRPPVSEASTYPCLDWFEWLRSSGQMYFEGPSKVIRLFAGQPDLVTLTDVRVDILRRTPRSVADGTWIKCNWGGGTFESYNIYVDTLKMRTTISANDVDGSGPERRMPPAAIALDETRQVDAEVITRSVPGHLYEGTITATISRNGKTESLVIGSQEQPLRWIEPDTEMTEDTEYYGWDPVNERWVLKWQPF
jgi:hypothetical protein